MQRGSNRTVALLLAILVAFGACVSAVPTAGAAPGTPRQCAVSRAKPARDYPAWLAAPGEALVTVGGVNLRAGPSTDCPVIATLGFGMQVRIANEMLAYDGQLWRKVETTLGEGYTIATAYQGMPEIAPAFVPVLMYHHIDERGGRYSVHPEVFAAQLAWLRDNGYVSITPRDLHNARYNGMPLPARPVMLTIDDGAPSTVTFKALLDQHGFRGVYFLPNFTTLTADQIRELAHSGEVCGHTVTHPSLDRLDYAGQYAEVANNKTWLEGIVGGPVSCFAYPFGVYNYITRLFVADSGYETAFNAWGGTAVLSGDADPYHVLRSEVYGGYDFETFVGLVYGSR